MLLSNMDFITIMFKYYYPFLYLPNNYSPTLSVLIISLLDFDCLIPILAFIKSIV